MMAWSRLPRARSGACIAAIFASTALSSSALPAAALSSRARSRIAAFSSSVNPFDALPVVLLAAFFAGFLSAIAERHLPSKMWTTLTLSSRARSPQHHATDHPDSLLDRNGWPRPVVLNCELDLVFMACTRRVRPMDGSNPPLNEMDDPPHPRTSPP